MCPNELDGVLSLVVACIVLAMAAHLITIRQPSSVARAPDKTSIEIHAVRQPDHRRLVSGGKSKIALADVDA